MQNCHYGNRSRYPYRGNDFKQRHDFDGDNLFQDSSGDSLVIRVQDYGEKFEKGEPVVC